ncbi:MAG: FMN-binding protein [Planctomycetes bacterium]|jgi:Na+-translocating ferredoxin:NAD+ oxidoreductase RnfG subunit|nr:FMN-binding protein [Planctomycetota bacterium]
MKARYVEYGGKLSIVCAVCILGVAGAYLKAKDRIAEGQSAVFREAIREVLGLPAGGPEPRVVNEEAAVEEQVFVAELAGEKRYATQGAHRGYSGLVVLAVGARLAEGKLSILDARVIRQTETPGLGTRIAERETNLTLWSNLGRVLGREVREETDWFFLKRLRGRGIDELSPADVAAVKITGVTISTNAAVEAARKALSRIREVIE